MIHHRQDRQDLCVAPVEPQSAGRFYRVVGQKAAADNVGYRAEHKHIKY